MKKEKSDLIYSEEYLDKPFELDVNNLQNYQDIIVSNKIIKANQQLTVTEKRIISYCISQIKHDDRHKKSLFYVKEFLERRKFSISTEIFADLYDYKNKNNAYRDLKAAAKSLFERSAQIKFEEQGEDYVRFVDRIRYSNGVVDLYFTPDIYLHLFEFDGNYTQYNLKIGTSFKSMYAHRIFELLQSRKDTNCVILSSNEFRFILGVPDSYKTYAKIREKVFEPTAKEFKKFGMDLEIKISKDPVNKGSDIISISTNKNVNDIVRELGLTEENKLRLISQLNNVNESYNTHYNYFNDVNESYNSHKEELKTEKNEDVETITFKEIQEEELSFELNVNNLIDKDYDDLVKMFTVFSKEDFKKMPKERLKNYVDQLVKIRHQNKQIQSNLLFPFLNGK